MGSSSSMGSAAGDQDSDGDTDAFYVRYNGKENVWLNNYLDPCWGLV